MLKRKFYRKPIFFYGFIFTFSTHLPHLSRFQLKIYGISRNINNNTIFAYRSTNICAFSSETITPLSAIVTRQKNKIDRGTTKGSIDPYPGFLGLMGFSKYSPVKFW